MENSEPTQGRARRGKSGLPRRLECDLFALQRLEMRNDE